MSAKAAVVGAVGKWETQSVFQAKLWLFAVLLCMADSEAHGLLASAAPTNPARWKARE
jgi:hypothetical protein